MLALLLALLCTCAAALQFDMDGNSMRTWYADMAAGAPVVLRVWVERAEEGASVKLTVYGPGGDTLLERPVDKPAEIRVVTRTAGVHEVTFVNKNLRSHIQDAGGVARVGMVLGHYERIATATDTHLAALVSDIEGRVEGLTRDTIHAHDTENLLGRQAASTARVAAGGGVLLVVVVLASTAAWTGMLARLVRKVG